MTTEAPQVPLRCRCGKVRGVAREVSPEKGSRLVCYCLDCQAFGDFLEQPGAPDVRGGTDVFHTAPARIKITDGASELRCMRLSDKGMYRWYTECCKTPIGNMVSPKLPFIGLIDAFMDHAGDGRSRDEVLGRPRVYLFPECAIGGLPPGVKAGSPLTIVRRTVARLFGWWREGKRAPSPFFRDERAPRVLSVAEREELRVKGEKRAARV